MEEAARSCIVLSLAVSTTVRSEDAGITVTAPYHCKGGHKICHSGGFTPMRTGVWFG